MSNKKPLTVINKPKYIVIHCSATDPTKTNIGFEWIDKLHKDNGIFSPVCVDGNPMYCGYHYVIKRDGTLENGRPEDKMGQHAQTINRQSIGICIVGLGDGKFNNTKQDLDKNFKYFTDSTNGIDSVASSSQKETLKKLIKKIMTKYGIKAENVIAHHDEYLLDKNKNYYWKSNDSKDGKKAIPYHKSCPNFSVKQYMTSEFIGKTYGEGEYNSWEKSAN